MFAFEHINSSGIQLTMPEYRLAKDRGCEMFLWTSLYENDVVAHKKSTEPYR
jgi:hypothetical protein